MENFGGKADPAFGHPELECCACGKLRKGRWITLSRNYGLSLKNVLRY